MINLLKRIGQDLSKHFNYEDIDNFFYLQYFVCRYIRNKYLWNNKSILNKFISYFNTTDIDELSYMIYEKIKNNDSKPK